MELFLLDLETYLDFYLFWDPSDGFPGNGSGKSGFKNPDLFLYVRSRKIQRGFKGEGILFFKPKKEKWEIWILQNSFAQTDDHGQKKDS